MKHILHCIGYIVTIEDSGKSWNITTSGNVPKSVQQQIDELKNNIPKPDKTMAFFLLKSIVKNDLQYIV